MRCHFTPTGKATVEKTDDGKCQQRWGESRTRPHCRWGTLNCAALENSLAILQMGKHRMTMCPGNSSWRILWRNENTSKQKLVHECGKQRHS